MRHRRGGDVPLVQVKWRCGNCGSRLTEFIAGGSHVLIGDRAEGRAWLAAVGMLDKVRVYSYSQRQNPPRTRIIPADGKPYSQVQPRGMAYRESLDEIIQREPVHERDRFFMAMLAPLGIEKGRPFKPDATKTEILKQGALIGELMSINISYAKRFNDSYYRLDTKWAYVIMLDPSQRTKDFDQLDERADYFYEAVTTTKGMVTKTPGVGQAYLGAYKDKNNNWSDGGKTYKLHVPPDPPARRFWSLTVYDVYDRVLINNKEEIADRSSRMDLRKEADGSVDIYMGPVTPKMLSDPRRPKLTHPWITSISAADSRCAARKLARSAPPAR